MEKLEQKLDKILEVLTHSSLENANDGYMKVLGQYLQPKTWKEQVTGKLRQDALIQISITLIVLTVIVIETSTNCKTNTRKWKQNVKIILNILLCITSSLIFLKAESTDQPVKLCSL